MLKIAEAIFRSAQRARPFKKSVIEVELLSKVIV
jgi:hypothetical protein